MRAPYPLIATLALTLTLAGCVRVPEGLEPVRGFEADRYLGTWYEIARLDHAFERGLTHVTATYGRRPDGGLSVVNRGWDPEAGAWDVAEGRAYFVADPDTGYLKVSFFGPFYGAYVVFALDPEYRWALVSGPDRGYLWLLARTPEIDPALRERLVERMDRAGFDVDGLLFVEQGDRPPGAPSPSS